MKLIDLTQENKSNYVGLLNEIQKNELVNQSFAPNSYFNPIQDINDNWIISIEEMEQCVNPSFIWIKDLELIIFVPKENLPI
jgi:hypothetical protein